MKILEDHKNVNQICWYLKRTMSSESYMVLKRVTNQKVINNKVKAMVQVLELYQPVFVYV